LNDAVPGMRFLSASFDLLIGYVKQELLAPLRGAWRWLGFGLLAAFFVVVASLLFLLGMLRLLQSGSLPFDGGWSWVPYVFVLLLAIVMVVLSVSRINKPTLNGGQHRGR
jgi:ABC-type uncharacterized transport system permease subunit